MKFKDIKAPLSTETIDRREMEKSGENIYSIINILGKRANQINSIIKTELYKKLDEFNAYNDSLEEVFENKEQIELSKFYEELPKPTAIAVQEFLDREVYFRKSEDDTKIDL
ncbi:DNA-directed RNA polymerase subunit omega [Bacteroidetes bacterium endosymbiont of Geopemphigus sp.]|uniref:DNA-directed RNA polymerase subunit omega n=1 Tax=Bacteroidetes bacterium endosymbiont of Geopemphigus sp. TaxID=2047937 RepID=UPI000CD011B4|nr:DNA-directed RNA polymerase subunit omega [Bacteroidetes bacterium endosymbiont of Geopemphigus sp.]